MFYDASNNPTSRSVGSLASTQQHLFLFSAREHNPEITAWAHWLVLSTATLFDAANKTLKRTAWEKGLILSITRNRAQRKAKQTDRSRREYRVDVAVAVSRPQQCICWWETAVICVTPLVAFPPCKKTLHKGVGSGACVAFSRHVLTDPLDHACHLTT